MIKESGISQQDQASNPQAIIDVIGFITESQAVNDEDHAFSKFTKFDNIYVEQLAPEIAVPTIPVTLLPLDSPMASPKPSPTLPKRPTTPAKPPRKSSTGTKEDIKLSSPAVDVRMDAKLTQSLPPPPEEKVAPPQKPERPSFKETRPPVPARPAHTLGIASTDVRQSIAKFM